MPASGPTARRDTVSDAAAVLMVLQAGSPEELDLPQSTMQPSSCTLSCEHGFHTGDEDKCDQRVPSECNSRDVKLLHSMDSVGWREVLSNAQEIGTGGFRCIC